MALCKAILRKLKLLGNIEESAVRSVDLAMLQISGRALVFLAFFVYGVFCGRFVYADRFSGRRSHLYRVCVWYR